MNYIISGMHTPVVAALGRLRQSCEFEGSLTHTVRPCFKKLEDKEAFSHPQLIWMLFVLCTPSSPGSRLVSYPGWANSERRQIGRSGTACLITLFPPFTSLLPPPQTTYKFRFEWNGFEKLSLSEEGVGMKVSLCLASQFFFRAFCRYFKHFKNYGDLCMAGKCCVPGLYPSFYKYPLLLSLCVWLFCLHLSLCTMCV